MFATLETMFTMFVVEGIHHQPGALQLRRLFVLRYLAKIQQDGISFFAATNADKSRVFAELAVSLSESEPIMHNLGTLQLEMVISIITGMVSSSFYSLRTAR